MKEDYRIISVESAEAPDNHEGGDWYCYTIGQGTNRIFGYRKGNLESIMQSVEELVVRLNERRIGSRGRVHIYMTSSGKDAKAE